MSEKVNLTTDNLVFPAQGDLVLEKIKASFIADVDEENPQDRIILQEINLHVPAGEVHVLMGPNGSGKSTLSNVLAGSPRYELLEGKASLGDVDLFSLPPEKRVAAGLFMAFQSPIELPGVSNASFLRAAVNAVRKERGEPEIAPVDFLKLVRKEMKNLGMSPDMLKRGVNAGFSGGERKRNEVLQMRLLQPTFAILDETDSGLDVDALKIIADGINKLKSPKFSALIVTHHHALLEYTQPKKVHILVKGKIVHSGGIELAERIQKDGYKSFLEAR
ncbi:Fe-S cluster assembly ATPase SufC [Acetobacteraceae bacterium]|nr:Fe-S cluster assembly ATPase SufC [Acetobacteraceae bacterium]